MSHPKGKIYEKALQKPLSRKINFKIRVKKKKSLNRGTLHGWTTPFPEDSAIKRKLTESAHRDRTPPQAPSLYDLVWLEH